jgi:hypothetical protein
MSGMQTKVPPRHREMASAIKRGAAVDNQSLGKNPF